MSPVACYHTSMYRVQVQLPEDEAERLREIARAQGVSMASVVREALAAYEPRSSRSGLLEIAGAFTDREGRIDVAEEHDRHVVEAVTERIGVRGETARR